MQDKILSYFKKIYPREKDSHKGDYGKVLILAGSKGMSGAAILASLASLRSGAGLAYLGIPQSLSSIVQERLTEVITVPLKETKSGSVSLAALKQIRLLLKKSDVVLIGPGLSKDKQTKSLTQKLLTEISIPVILDADGINSFAGRTRLLKKRKSGSLILTPHLGEFSGISNIKIDKIKNNRDAIAKDFAKKFNLTLILKGHNTLVVSPNGDSYVNDSGNPGMATAGSGDVLSGIAASLRAQGLSDYEAACLGVYVHGRAGDLTREQKTEISLLASDIVDFLPVAFKELEHTSLNRS
ncbi:MAG: NAD(P)H-hydrate dehydratase [Candidatus Kaelpia aquatica]|nr:NAD(P)H-hydrate dehydratase [Candidatus Kaelpia aquatica]